MAGLVFVGAATYDVIACVPRFPGPDERIVASAFSHAGGGNAATAAVTAARLGAPAAFVGPVGDGVRGDHVLAGLEESGVDVSGVVRVPAEDAGESVVLVDSAAATRAIVTRSVPAFEVPRDGAGGRLVRGAEWVHVDHRGWPVLAGLVELGARGPAVSVDEGILIPDLVPAAVDLYVPTLAVLRARYGPDGAPDATLLDRAVAAGAGVVVATDGARGCLAARAGERWRVPACEVDVVSTLGAGDVFHGALVVAVARGDDLDTAVRYATVAAGLSCRTLDARSGLPDDARVRSLLGSVPPGGSGTGSPMGEVGRRDPRG